MSFICFKQQQNRNIHSICTHLCNRIASTTDWMYVIARKGGKVSIECTGAFPISFFPLNVIFPLWTIFRKVISLQTAYYLREEKLVKTMMKLENAKLIRATCNITPAPDNRNNRQGIWNILSNFGLLKLLVPSKCSTFFKWIT